MVEAAFEYDGAEWGCLRSVKFSKPGPNRERVWSDLFDIASEVHYNVHRTHREFAMS